MSERAPKRQAFVLAATVALATALPASALVIFYVKHDQWSVTALPGHCVAFNRPVNENAATPFNSLELILKETGLPILQVRFWPGYLRAGQSYKMLLKVDGAAAVPVPAKTVGSADFMLESSEPLAKALTAALDSGKMLSINVEGKPQGLVFEIDSMHAVLESLKQCGSLLKIAK